jgi:hypothetical protein
MNRALASIVLSLIMLTGVTAGSVAFAESDEIELKGILSVIDDNTFELDTENGIETLSINDDTIIDNGLSLSELDGLVVDVDAVLIDDVLFATEVEFEGDDDIIAEYDVKDYDIREKLDRYCEMTDDEKRELISKYDKAEDHVTKMDAYCELDENERDVYIDEYEDEFRMQHDYDIREKLDEYCLMTEDEKADFISKHEKEADHVEKINEYCDLAPEDRDAYIAEHKDKYKKHTDEEFREKLDAYCDLSDADRAAYIAEHDKTDEKAAKMDRYCTLDENGKTDFISENIDEYRAYMMDRYPDKFHGSDMMRDSMPHDFDRMSDVAKGHMSDVAKDRLGDHMMYSDMSPRLHEMIMSKYDISDERHDEIRMKYEEKHGDEGDKKRTELRIKFKDHMAKIEIKITDERKFEVRDRVAEMKEFKAELRVRSTEMTDEQKQELREDFIEKAKDMQLAWISPRHQMHAGIDAADIECREGFSHVLKESNGVAMCLKADTALKMIDRGIAVPAN